MQKLPRCNRQPPKFAENGIAVRFIESRARDAVRRLRLARRNSGWQEISDARLEDFEALDSGYQSPDEIQSGELIFFDSEAPPEKQLPLVLEKTAEKTLPL